MTTSPKHGTAALRRAVRRHIREAWSERPGPMGPGSQGASSDVTDVIVDPGVARKVDELVDLVVDYVVGEPQEASMLRDSINDGIRNGLRYAWA